MAYDGSKELTESSLDEKAEILAYMYNSFTLQKPLSARTKMYVLGGVALTRQNEPLTVSEKAYKKLSDNKSAWLDEDGCVFRKSQRDVPDLIMEHSIPIKVLHDFLDEKTKDGALLTTDCLRDFIKSFCKTVLITKEEDVKLRNEGLQQKMPEGWTFEKGDVFERYHKCGITLQKNKMSRVVKSFN